jgi:hypothetical protein
MRLCAGEPCFLPQQFRTQRPISNPTEYTRLWVSEVAGQFQGGVCEVRTPALPTIHACSRRPKQAPLCLSSLIEDYIGIAK